MRPFLALLLIQGLLLTRLIVLFFSLCDMFTNWYYWQFNTKSVFPKVFSSGRDPPSRVGYRTYECIKMCRSCSPCAPAATDSFTESSLTVQGFVAFAGKTARGWYLVLYSVFLKITLTALFLQPWKTEMWKTWKTWVRGDWSKGLRKHHYFKK